MNTLILYIPNLNELFDSFTPMELFDYYNAVASFEEETIDLGRWSV